MTRRDLRPLREKMEGLIRELLGPDASKTQVRFCAVAVVSQCVIPMLMTRMERGAGDGKADVPGIEDIDSYADHVVRFTLAGIRALREELEKNTKQNQRGIHENQ